MASPADPIAAIATAPGRGGIGVVRVSGTALSELARVLCGRTLAPRHATLTEFRDARGQIIDQGIALFFPAPHSYTGEDVLELQGHGGPVVLGQLLSRVLETGHALGLANLRLAEPGEFTRRAYLHDKLDLAQAEAVADLIDASTEAAARSAARSLSGEFSQAVSGVLESLIELRMRVEATLDFPEEEIDFLREAHASERLAALTARVQAVLAVARQGALLRQGLQVVLAGAPNVGKSSLLNALAGAEVAIVTPIAGTTRDRISQPVQIEGVALNVIDTAGLRQTADTVERLGIERTWDAVARADVVLHLRELRQTPGGAEQAAEEALVAELGRRVGRQVPVIEVWNKIDQAGLTARDDESGVWISARTGEGLAGLRRRLLAVAGWQSGLEGVFMARERHLEALRETLAHLGNASGQLAPPSPALELFAEELRLAQEALNRVTGEFGADDLLGVIFSRFCIGK